MSLLQHPVVVVSPMLLTRHFCSWFILFVIGYLYRCNYFYLQLLFAACTMLTVSNTFHEKEELSGGEDLHSFQAGCDVKPNDAHTWLLCWFVTLKKYDHCQWQHIISWIKLFQTIILLLWWTEIHLNRRVLTWLHFRCRRLFKQFSKIT